MDVVVVGKHVEVAPELRSTTEQKIARLARFAADVRRVEVDYGEIANPRVADSQTCEILVHVTGHLVKGHAAAPDHHAALDLALDKVDHQLRRLHDRRTRKRSARRNGGRGNGAAADGESEGDGALVLAPFDAGQAGADDDGPVIVKSKSFSVKPMDPEEAALQMDLLGHDFFLFTIAASGRAAVVYRRRDGRVGLIEATG